MQDLLVICILRNRILLATMFRRNRCLTQLEAESPREQANMPLAAELAGQIGTHSVAASSSARSAQRVAHKALRGAVRQWLCAKVRFVVFKNVFLFPGGPLRTFQIGEANPFIESFHYRSDMVSSSPYRVFENDLH